VKARHFDLTPALKAHAEEKLGQAIMRIFDRPALKIEIELSDLGDFKDKNNKECRVTVSIPRGKTINISEVDDNMYKAVDLCHDRLLVQVKREVDKRRDTTRTRKSAQKNRQTTAHRTMTAPMETWEREVELFETSTLDT
ncbi:MAG: HPF/RaiA family ribosome-associated protein, partial [Bdellovibrionota bacterium]